MKRTLFAYLALSAASAAAMPSVDNPASAARAVSAMPATAQDVASVLERIGTEDKQVEGRLGELTRESVTLHALLIARGRSYVKMARAGLLPVGAGLDALVDHASRLERLRRSLARDLDRELRISAERIDLGKRHDSLDDRRTVLESEHAALARSHVAIAAAEDRESAFRHAFLGSHEAVRHTAVYGSGFGPADPSDVSAGFGGQKGRLPFPIEGRVEIRPARLPSADGPGLEMVAAEGAAVRAVYPGRVAFADAYADYGSAVIIDHGSGFYTVSGNMAGIEVKVGDQLGAGDRLGTVGAGPHGIALYFEIRRGTTAVNPAPWFGI